MTPDSHRSVSEDSPIPSSRGPGLATLLAISPHSPGAPRNQREAWGGGPALRGQRWPGMGAMQLLLREGARAASLRRGRGMEEAGYPISAGEEARAVMGLSRPWAGEWGPRPGWPPALPSLLPTGPLAPT